MSKPGRFSPGSDSESDWLEEDDVDVDQEAGPSRPRAASPTKKKARIAAPGDKVDSGMSAHTAHRLSQAYRQPKWRKLSNLVSHDVYEIHSTSAKAVRQVERKLERFQDRANEWGIIEDKQPRSMAGRCSQCQSKDVDCIVQLAPVDSELFIVSACIACHTFHHGCDLLIRHRDEPYQARSAPARRSSGTRASPRKPPVASNLRPASLSATASRTSSIKASKVAVPRPPTSKAPLPIDASGLRRNPKASSAIAPVSAALSASNSLPESPDTSSRRPRLDKNIASAIAKESADSAVKDLGEFVLSMRGKLPGADLKTRSMFFMIEDQLSVIRKYVEETCVQSHVSGGLCMLISSIYYRCARYLGGDIYHESLSMPEQASRARQGPKLVQWLSAAAALTSVLPTEAPNISGPPAPNLLKPAINNNFHLPCCFVCTSSLVHPHFEPAMSQNRRRSRSASDSTTSDWRDEIEFVEPDEGGINNVESRQNEAEYAPSPQARKKRKSTQKAVQDVDVDSTGKEQARGSFVLVNNIRENTVWQTYCEKVSDTLQRTAGSKSEERTSQSLKQLSDFECTWGIIRESKMGDKNSSCMACFRSKEECIVKVSPQPAVQTDSAGSSAPSTSYRAISRCIRCIAQCAGCDAYLSLYSPSSSQNPKSAPSTKAKSKPKVINDPPLPRRSTQSASQAVTKSVPARQPTREQPTFPAAKPSTRRKVRQPDRAPSEPDLSWSVEAKPATNGYSAPSLSPQPESDYGAPESSREDVLTAISDVKEFADNMRKILSEKGKLDLPTRSLFLMAEHQIQLIEKYVEERCISAARGGMPVVYGISVPGFRSPSAELTAHQFLILSFSFTLFRTAPLHGIMVAPVKKERSPSVDDESDWLEEDDYVEPFAPPAPAKRPLGGNGSTQLPSKKRKSEGGAASTADGVKGDSSHQYRQPSFTHLPAVRQHSLWREGCKRFETLSKDYALKSMTVRRAGANLDKLQDKTAIWGIVDLDQPGGAEGPCSTCMDGGIDCIVRLEPKASTSKQGRCLHCHMWNKGCDLFLTKLKTPGGSTSPDQDHAVRPFCHTSPSTPWSAAVPDRHPSSDILAVQVPASPSDDPGYSTGPSFSVDLQTQHGRIG
ncbi:uncharacterized protein MKK02DRAFT_32994 [Dioszegia hungarica]|uniref:Cytochrome c domain-containing protein n=1 Tax=Dioszegia hungarica TaxID=4972 RepID=A0AA38H8A4_9TREE|nr:uncharacterized protein MKK02DRAFT_32994 [Dioszegia hungarica]KAI9635613.1 hypothetical protein MKK02DRAFT_32994 [Dioszegia hungarica]